MVALGVSEVLDWPYVDVICVVIICHLIASVPVDGSD